ncbi:WbqC family protein [Kitasatospora aureofaciens]|uniref:WbqC family protein n=1 Tax=Kitasatospora aureofaciens TaxID=1894 RepID=UPI001C44AC0A|nr:WbqC family protein [Kitasatospora aureofaciens]MBV6702761.1 WbqC family protein [Kitasatospora aureofaciens]
MIYIEQPAFLPWLAFCEALLACDTVVLYDDVQFEDGGWQNRNKIRTKSGIQWLTVPVVKQHGQRIEQARIAANFDADTLLRTLAMAYSRTPFYAETMATITPALEAGHQLLADLNADLLTRIHDALGATGRLLRSSTMPLPASGRIERIVAVCEHTGEQTLWAGSGTRGYLDTAAVGAAGIRVLWNEYYPRHPIYPQTWPRRPFTPALSVADAACNLGWAGLRTLLTDGFTTYQNELDGVPA